MFKGKSTIELFDGITGKKKEERKDDNMVTNAIQNLFSYSNEMLVFGVPLNDVLARVTPLYPQYLRGILLWDNIISEDVNNVLPPPGIGCVGHAGSTYSGANIFRGTLNENETVVSANGVKMVWDFGTDKANGTIRSVSLTSASGGDKGWMTPGDDPGTFFRERINNGSRSQTLVEYTPRTMPSSFTAASFNERRYIGEIRRGIHTYMINRNGTVSIIEMSYINPTEIGIYDGAGLFSIAQPYCRETIFEIPGSSGFTHLYANSIIIGNKLVHVTLSGTGNRTARIRTIDFITKSITEDRTVSLSPSHSFRAQAAAYFQDRLYAVNLIGTTADGVCEFDRNGGFIRRIMNANPANSHTSFHCIDGKYLSGPPDSNTPSAANHFFYDGYKTVVMKYGNEDSADGASLLHAASLKLPLAILYRETGGVAVKSINYITPYMATINNLSAPVTKNEQNTMKITYELTQE
jgi:hypothetical protein